MKMGFTKTRQELPSGVVALARRQDGFASIAIALVLILVLALVTVGFAQLARREQQSALSRQLASQASYAAESAINDTIADIKNGGDFNVVDKDDCYGATNEVTGAPNVAGSLSTDDLSNSQISAGASVGYTCVLVDVKPDNLQYNLPSPFSSQSAVFSSASSNQINTLNISWNSYTNHNTFVSSGQDFLPATSWNYAPVIKVTLTPLNDTSGFSRSDLIKNALTTYMYPSVSGSNTSVAFPVSLTSSTRDNSAEGSILNGHCSNTTPAGFYACQASITGLVNTVPSFGDGHYLITMESLYDGANIYLSAKDLSGNDVNFAGAEAQIDATGKAKDVLKRLQVHVNLPGQPAPADLPTDAIEAKNLCKRFDSHPNIDGTYTTNYDGFSGDNGSCDYSSP